MANSGAMRQAKYRQNNPKKVAAARKKRVDSGANAAWQRQWHKLFPEKRQRYNMWHRYQMTVEDYEIMWVEQNGLCAICFEPETSSNQYGPRRLVIDHSHITGTTRKLLCNRCNMVLGKMQDDPALLIAAAEYLKNNA